MQKIGDLFFILALWAVFLISISKYKGNLAIMPSTLFWSLYVPMVVLLAAYPFVRHYEKKNKLGKKNG